MSVVDIKADSSALDTYYKNLDALKKNLKLTSEGSTRRAFGRLLEDTSSVRKWTLAEEVTMRKKTHRIRLDGVLYGKGSLPRGYWEAKDESDNLDTEILKKKAKEYPVNNIIFEDTQRAILIQDTVQVEDIALDKPDDLARLLSRFYNYEMTPFEEFDKAVEWFSDIIPDIGRDLTAKIAESHKHNKRFQTEFAEFMELCKTALNPNISKEAVDEMLIQHLLTERLIRNIFQSDFTRRNVIANKVEDVISALTQPLFDRAEFQQSLDSFYKVIENAANSLVEDYQAKQSFINTVYEQFFQGYSVKTADTHGIVYTPQEIVDFMCAAVEEVLEDEFGKKLGQEGVAVLDPATGTGNFIINLLNRVNPRYRREFYKHHLFANEVMLMPYYIASLNIENEYYELEGEYEPFEGLAFVDTLDLAKKKQLSFDFMTEKNSVRVKRQQESDITVIIGNPPYNMGQVNDNDNNKNRAYKVIDERIAETYSKDSQSNNRNALYDAYVKFFRWASDRLGDNDGVICYVTNNGFVDGRVFNGMRKHLMQDFQRIYHLDLGGNIRKNKTNKSVGNVFDIRVGVGITIAIRNSKYKDSRLFYHAVTDTLSKEKKLELLTHHVKENGTWNALSTINWERLKPNNRHMWLIPDDLDEFESMIPIGIKADKNKNIKQAKGIFHQYSRGIQTSRDTTVYDYNKTNLDARIKQVIENYNSEVDRYKREGKPTNLDKFVDYSLLDWSYWLKQHLKQENYIEYSSSELRQAIYRPFSHRNLYFNKTLINSTSLFPYFLPDVKSENENRVIWYKVGAAWPQFALVVNQIPDLLPQSGSQCFPFYVYDEDGNNRRENITDWALEQFQTQYSDKSITKWDIFYYVYGLLHHPEYRERYADNLKRELPRIPFVPNPSPSPSPLHSLALTGGEGSIESGFWLFSQAGKDLAESHLNYEDGKRYEGIEWDTNSDVKPTYKVEKMRPVKKRKMPLSEIIGLSTDDEEQDNSPEVSVYNSLKVNEYLMLTGIPEEAFAYRLGNRSALDWIVDQYRIKTDKRSGITSDPNGYSDDEQYIVKLVERVVQVSVDTVAIVKRLAEVEFRE